MSRYLNVALVTVLMLLSQSVPAEVLAKWTAGRTPPLALKDSQGRMQSLDQYRGQVVVVNFWATWCEPCLEEMPSLDRMKTAMDGRKFAVLAVNLGEGEARINAFADKLKIYFPLLVDRDGVAKRDWKVQGAPATFVIDERGRIRYFHVGTLDFTSPKVQGKIAGLLKNIKNISDRKMQ
ncbi:MAG: TlpA disulfide reductase family protein [Betaproteobacteria bacterium]